MVVLDCDHNSASGLVHDLQSHRALCKFKASRIPQNYDDERSKVALFPEFDRRFFRHQFPRW